MKPYLAKLLARTEAALFRRGYDAAKLNPVAIEADERGGARVKIETYAPGPVGQAWYVNPLKLREALEEEGLLPITAGYPERPDTILLCWTHHKPRPPKGYVGPITDEYP